MTKIFSLQLPDSTYFSLEKLSKKEKRSKGFLVREILDQYIQDYVDIKYAKEALKEIKSGKAKLVSWEKMKKDYGLED